jgi:uncharacterized protein (TIGR02996 family)
MSERDDLYQAILAAPEDDAPRLIYADWLDEHGDPARAEFIRAQIAAAAVPEETSRWREPTEQADRLLRDHRVSWLGPVLERAQKAECRRGFVDGVRVTVDQFLSSADKLLRLEPIRMWEFAPMSFFLSGPGFERLADDPAFARVRGLSAGAANPDELLLTLTRSSHLTGLRRLEVRGQNPSGRSIGRLFDAAPGLTELDAEHFSLAAVRHLWRKSGPARLTRLRLDSCRVTDGTVAYIAGSPAAARLTSLILDGNEVSRYGVEALANSDTLPNLRELGLAGCPLGDRGATVLARCPGLRSLEVLNLAGCQLDSAGAQALADSPHLSGLRCLCLDENRVSVEVEAELEKRFGPGICSFSWSGR